MTEEQEKKLDEVHAAIVGNPKIGHKGLIPRMDEVETYQQQDAKFKARIIAWVTGAIAIGTPVIILIWDVIKTKYL